MMMLHWGYIELLALTAVIAFLLLFEISKLYHWRQSKTLLVWSCFSVLGLSFVGSGFFMTILRIVLSCGVGHFFYNRILDHRDKNTFLGLICIILVFLIWSDTLF